MEQGPLLELQGLAYRVDGHTLIQPLSLSVAPGEIISILGQSGSGKSTLLQLISGLLAASSGKIVSRGQDWHVGNHSIVPTQKRNLAYVFQDPSLFPHLTVRENIQIAVARSGQSAREPYFSEIIALTGISHILDRLPRQISGGQAQRAAIARALFSSPDLMLLDEPFSSLDRPTATQMRRELQGWLRTYNIAACFVTHNPDEAFDLSQRIGFLQAGFLLQLASPDELYYRPANLEIAHWTGEGRVSSLDQHLAAETDSGYLQREFRRHFGELPEFSGSKMSSNQLYVRAVDWCLDSGGWPFEVVACQFRGDYFMGQVRGSSGIVYPVRLETFFHPGSLLALAYRPRVRPTLIG